MRPGTATDESRAGPSSSPCRPATEEDPWHRFVNPGPGRLNLVGIHASDVIEQEFRDEQG